MLKNMRSRIPRVIAGAAVLALLATACGETNEPSEGAEAPEEPESTDAENSETEDEGEAEGDSGDADTITIGMAVQFTGNLAWYGDQLSKGYQLAQEKINEEGGINGKNLRFVRADVPDPAAAAGEIDRLDSNGIKVVIGTGSSAVALAATAQTNQRNMIWWESNGLSNEITARGLEYVFQFGPNNIRFAEAAVSMLEELAPEMLGKPLTEVTVATVWENSEYGEGQSGLQKEALEELGVELVEDLSYDRTTTDLSPVVLQMQRANPDVVLETGYQDDIVLLWRQARELGYLPQLVISSGAAATTDFRDALGADAVEGIIGYNYPLAVETNEGGQEFIERFETAFQEPPPSGHSLAAYSAMLALADVMREAGGDDPDAIAEIARQADQPAGTYPNGAGMQFDENQSNTRSQAAGFQWQGGEIFTIWPESVREADPIGPLVPWGER